MKLYLNLAKAFTAYPIGRCSAEKLRPYLVEALHNNDKVLLDLGEVETLSSSFLDELLGGMVRKSCLSKHELKNKLDIICEPDPEWVKDCWLYIEN